MMMLASLLLPASLKAQTGCDSAYPTPFYDNFLTMNVNNTCWIVGSGVTWNSTTVGGNTVRRMEFAYSAPPRVLKTPVIDAPVNEWYVRIGFRARNSSAGFVSLGVVDGNDSLLAMSDTSSGAEIYSSFSDVVFEKEARFPDVTQTGCRLAIYGNCLQLFWVEIYAGGCEPVETLVLNDLSDHTAEVSWSDAQTGNYMVVCSSENGIDTLFVNETEVALNGLVPMTSYQVQVFPICNGTDTALYSTKLRFRTLRGEVTLPYIEDFERCERDSVPDAWTVLQGRTVSGRPYPSVTENTTAHGGNHYLELNASSQNPNLIVTPRLPQSAQGYLVSFWISGTHGFAVGTIDSTLNPNSFVAVQTYTHNISFADQWYRYELQVSNSASRHVAIQLISYGNTYRLDDFEVHAYGECTVPTVTGYQATNHGFTFQWDSTGASSYQLCWSMTGDLADADTATVSANSITLDTLQPNTLYHFWLRGVCGENNISAWNWMGTYRTECLPMVIPYSETFDEVPLNTQPTCWYLTLHVRVQGGGTYGTRGLYFDAGDSRGVLATTDPVTLPADSINVAFRLKSLNLIWTSGFRAGVITDPEDLSTFIPLIDTTPETAQWLDLSFNTFGMNLSGPVRVAFWLQNGPAMVDDVRIDSVADVWPECHAASGLRLENADSTSVELLWDATGDSYEVAVLDADSNLLFIVPADSNHITVTGLQPLTNYRFALRTACPNGPMEWTTTVGTRTTCPAHYPLPWGENFDSLPSSGLLDCWSRHSEWPLYRPVQNQMFSHAFRNNEAYVSTPVLAGADTVKVSFRLSISKAYLFDNTPAHLQVGVLPADGSVSAFVALFDTSTMQLTSDVLVWDTVEFLYVSAGEDFRLTFHFYDGYFGIDDITVVPFHTDPGHGPGPVPPQPVCEVPTGLHVTDIDSTSAIVAWTPGGEETEWELLFAGDGQWSVRTADNPYTVMGLRPGTTYSVRVRALCNDTLASVFSDVVAFTTNENNVVGIEPVKRGALVLYPNPAGSSVTLRGLTGRAEVEVMDMNGRRCKHCRLEEGQATIDLSSLPQGAYYVRVTQTERVSVLKLIVR